MSSQTPFSHGQLAYFVRVAEEGQVTRAARSLYVAQPALSQAIARLEARLGVQLLRRHPRGVTLTAAGEIFYERARAALAADEALRATAGALSRSGLGCVEVGFVGAPPHVLAPDALERFARRCPDAEVAYRELRFPTQPLTEWIAGIDVAICFSAHEQPGVEVRPLHEEERCVLLSDAHPLARRCELQVQDVLDEEFCGMHPSVDHTWAGFWRLEDHRGGPPARVTADTPSSYLELLAALAAGHGIIAIASSVARTMASIERSLVSVPLAGAAPATCALVWSAPLGNPVAAAFIAAASEPEPGEPEPGAGSGARAGSADRQAAAPRRVARPSKDGRPQPHGGERGTRARAGGSARGRA